ncbi:hypothetical protein KR084_006029 [Drosophila pseudotakahashii]|nr:hypothetical protein KR084_006029 [Drosophila pseudotakahashii]
MLERIDEQTAAMSQRSERLKMMKLQYQMYFAKLVQNQTLRCIQQTTTSSSMAPTAGGVMPVPVLMQPQPQVATNPQSAPQPWTFAMATPTQAGMLLTPQFATAAVGPPVSPMPISTPIPAAAHPVYYPDLFGPATAGAAAPLGTSNLFDLRATLRAFDNENADLPERMQPHLTGDYQAELGGGSRVPPPATAAATPTSTLSSGENQVARQLSSTSSTMATSSLTFDKLPKTSSPSLTLTELPTAGGAAGATAGQNMDEQPQGEVGKGDLDAWTNSRVTKVEYEKSPTVVKHNETGQRHRQQQQQHQEVQQQHQPSRDFEAYFGELKIDESKPKPQLNPNPNHEDKRPLNVRSSELVGGVGVGSPVGGQVGISNDLLDEVKASRAALERAAAAVDEQLARGNQLSPPSSQEQPETGVSIENIENAIYGERLTGGEARGGGAGIAGGVTELAAIPTQGFFENLVTNTSPEVELQEVEQQQQQQPEVSGYGQYEASSYGEASEPIYASIDSVNLQPPKVEPLYSEIGNPTDYQAYGVTTTDTGADVPAAAAAAAPVAAPNELTGTTLDTSGEVLPQEYSNIDYGNYEAGQYAAAGYDPNAYPGYIYDEATGQYIADPNAAQYAPDGSYGNQEYDASGVGNYDYSGYEQSADQQLQQEELQPGQEQRQQQQQEGYPNEGVEEAPVEAPPEVAIESPAAPAAAAPMEPVKPSKPTSILSTTDKQAALNDAQQQQLKKKKRVNFVDSSETDDSSSAKPTQAANPGAGGPPPPATASSPATPPMAAGGGSESDFDFSTGSEAKN